MEVVHTSQTAVYSDETIQRYSPEGFHLHTCHHENLKSRTEFSFYCKFFPFLSPLHSCLNKHAGDVHILLLLPFTFPVIFFSLLFLNVQFMTFLTVE
jgi:hypothetical protein